MARVYTPRALRACHAHYFRLAPVAYTRDRVAQWWHYHPRPFLRGLVDRLGCVDGARRVRRLPPIPTM